MAKRQSMPAAAAQASGGCGLVIGADERGLRESLRRVCAAAAVGRKPLEAVAALSGASEFSPEGPALAVSTGVAVIDVVGPLSKGADVYNWFFGTLTYPQLVAQLEAARRDVRVRATLIRIDSPGGNVAGVSDLCEAILALRASKPVIAAISDLGASCAYQAAACANKIFVDRDGWAGSIGVFVVIDDVSQMYSDAGWKVQVFATQNDPYKGAGMPGTAVSQEQASEYQRIVDELGTEMIRSIYAGRAAMRSGGMKLPDGRLYMGEDARAKGLADGVASWQAVLAAMQAGDYEADCIFP